MPLRRSYVNCRAFGFSLVELMVVLAIIAVLTQFALPAYNDHIARGKIAEATGALSEMRSTIEQWYADNRTYAGYPCTNSVQPSAAASRNFDITCDLQANAYVMTATGRPSMSGYAYTVNQANARTSSTPKSSGNCWIMKNGGSC